MTLDEWRSLMSSGKVTHVRPRKWCGVWQIHAYNRNLHIPLIDSIEDSSEAWQACRDAGVSLEEPF